MRDLGTVTTQVDLTVLEVMEPKMLVSDALKCIYINESMEEAIRKGSAPKNGNSEGIEIKDGIPEETVKLKAEYDAVCADHEGYATRLHRMPITLDFMKRYALAVNDSYMIDLIARKEGVLVRENETHEVSLFYAFKNMFTARYPIAKNVYKATKKLDEIEAKRRSNA